LLVTVLFTPVNCRPCS